MKGDYQGALESYEGALVIDPQYRDALFRKGISLMALGRDGEAEGLFEGILEADPGYKQAANGKGLMMQKRGEYSAAGALFENASKIDPAWSQPRYNLVHSLIEQHRMQEAMTIFVTI